MQIVDPGTKSRWLAATLYCDRSSHQQPRTRTAASRCVTSLEPACCQNSVARPTTASPKRCARRSSTHPMLARPAWTSISHVSPRTRELSVIDDGIGMSTKDFCEQFMSLGGSSKFGDSEQFGRIGIGSLALVQYADAAIIETKPAGTRVATRARLQHPWALAREERRGHLAEMAAGFAEEFEHPGDPDDHFTRIRLEGLKPEVSSIGHDPGAFYKLVEDLRRLLPLPWNDGRLADALKTASAEMVSTLTPHIDEWSTPVYVHSSWERDIRLVRRAFGEDQAGVEDWSGPPVPILKTLRVSDETGRREIMVAGLPAESEACPSPLGRANGARAERGRRTAHLLRRHR